MTEPNYMSSASVTPIDEDEEDEDEEDVLFKFTLDT